MIDKFYDGTELLSIVIRRDFSAQGIEFFTPDDFSQQLAYMKRPKAYDIPPHVHNFVKREVVMTQEVLYVKSGKVRVDFYNQDKVYKESTVLLAGDVILLASGGHGFHMLEESEIIEVKQGPYAGEVDKVRFTSVPEDKVLIK